MKKFKKILCCVLTGCLTACLLSACSAKASEEDTASSAEETVQAVENNETEASLTETGTAYSADAETEEQTEYEEQEYEIPAPVPTDEYANLNGSLVFNINGTELTFGEFTVQDLLDAGYYTRNNGRDDMTTLRSEIAIYQDSNFETIMFCYIDGDANDLTCDYKDIPITTIQLYEGVWDINGYTFNLDEDKTPLDEVMTVEDGYAMNRYTNAEYGYTVYFYDDDSGGINMIDIYINDRSSLVRNDVLYDDDSVVLNGTELSPELSYDEICELLAASGMEEDDFGYMTASDELSGYVSLYPNGSLTEGKWVLQDAECQELVVAGFITPGVTTKDEVISTLGMNESYSDFEYITASYGHVVLWMRFNDDGVLRDIDVHMFEDAV